MQTFHHWHWHQDSSQVLWIEFDREGKSANTINSDVLEEFGQILGLIADLSEVKQVVICSKKRTGFIAGADILDVFASQDLEKTKTLIERGQKVFDQLQNLPMPTIALIHGFCLGGGFELALACDWRIVIDSPQVRIGLPEVQLGLQPGWGGSVRLMRLIGVKRTFELILSGKMLKAHQAKRMQIIDEVIAERLTPEILNHYVQKRPKMRCRWDWLWKISFARVVFGQMIRKQIQQKANKEFYPAPFAMIQNWEELGHHNDTSFQREIDSIYQLAQTSTAKNLVRVFGLKDANKKTMAPSSVEIRHVHVVGAGIMGGDIAAWIALKGYTVTLQDVNPKQLSYALNRASKIFSRQCTQPFDIQRCMDRLIIDQAGEGLKNADVIIEAVTEQLALKLEILKNIEKNSRKDAIIATNTSTISLENMDHVFKNSKRFVGIHFFNPVPLMPLVEIVIGNLTGDEAIHAAHHFVQKIDKIAIKVKSAPGFFVNRVLLPYMLEAMLLVEEGYRLEQVDKAATDFGMPMGPIELADTVGLDVCLAALSSMNLTTDCVSAHLQRRIQQGHLGKKTGKGFYEYSKNKAIKREEKYFSDRDFCQNRLIYALCNEAVSALEQGIVSSEDDADLASLFGFGFPPFRGGIIHYIRETGVESLLKRFEKIIQKSKNLSSGWHSLSLEK
jgi:3-hydroxyacyl-CoA dehydrogenase/enoyl-CoA hydratase/3-hydroxybutyryl-CoA epimerase